MTITMSEIEHVANLAKLGLTEEQRPYVQNRISSLLNYMQQQPDINLTNVEPTTYVLRLTNVFREDNPLPCLPREAGLALAPEHEGGYFKVPSIL